MNTPTLDEQWKLILTKAWSMRFMALGALCAFVGIITSVLPGLIQMTVWRMVGLAVLTLIFNFLGMWSRVVAQKGFDSGSLTTGSK